MITNQMMMHQTRESIAMEEEKGGNQRLESFMVVDFEKNGPT